MTYGKRLEHAISLAKADRAAVALATGRSVQAIGQVLTGKSAALTAENSAKAARFLEVDHYWLATGEGKPRPDSAWPFESILPSQYFRLDQAIREEVEDRLLGAVLRQDKANGTHN